MELMKYVEGQIKRETNFPSFRPGDNITVNVKIVEGNKERVQAFKGDVIQLNGEGVTKTFTVRKISNSVGVERVFPFNSPSIVDIILNKRGRVRRAKLFYLRKLTGKSARIKEDKSVRS
jgi:large subunit ribosomal protein L19